MVAVSKHVLVILESGAVPFCIYENPHFHTSADARWMPEALLGAIVRRARKEQIALTFVLGRTRPPAKLERLLESVDHAKIVPLSLHKTYPDGVLVLDSDERSSFAALSNSLDRNVILRVARQDLGRCSALVESLIGKFRRLSLHPIGVEYFAEADLVLYQKELGKIARALDGLYREGEPVEINVLTDRMLLTEMRNCAAGVDHLTVAPNGKLYLCPAFYYDAAENFIGAFDNKNGFAARRIAAVELARAPICSRCDAFHCKRCVFLNRRTTLELNIPSEQQCAVAHIEREASRRLLTDLGSVEPFRRMPRIAELNYRDPLECIDAPPHDLQTRATDPATDPML